MFSELSVAAGVCSALVVGLSCARVSAAVRLRCTFAASRSIGRAVAVGRTSCATFRRARSCTTFRRARSCAAFGRGCAAIGLGFHGAFSLVFHGALVLLFVGLGAGSATRSVAFCRLASYKDAANEHAREEQCDPFIHVSYLLVERKTFAVPN